eukprot:1152177-Pelagomonas_calceolata.AAC.1
MHATAGARLRYGSSTFSTNAIWHATEAGYGYATLGLCQSSTVACNPAQPQLCKTQRSTTTALPTQRTCSRFSSQHTLGVAFPSLHVSWGVLMYLHGCGQLSQRPRVMERIAFKVDTGEGYVCRGVSSP